MMPWWAYLAVVVWVVGWLGAVALEEPDTAMDGAFLLLTMSFLWPLFALGWIVSRPWA